MQRTAWGLALASSLALIAGTALAQDAPGAANDAGKDASAACAPAASSAAADVSASGGAGSDTHNLKVFSCNGVRIGTAISTSKGPDGTVLVITPDVTFLNGIASIEIPASNVASNDGEIRLAMTDRALREALATGDKGTKAK